MTPDQLQSHEDFLVEQRKTAKDSAIGLKQLPNDVSNVKNVLEKLTLIYKTIDKKEETFPKFLGQAKNE